MSIMLLLYDYMSFLADDDTVDVNKKIYLWVKSYWNTFSYVNIFSLFFLGLFRNFY